jgi:hypothetical protein
VRLTLLPLLLTAIILVPRGASAQQYLIGASGEVASGVEGGTALKGFQVARTRLRLGVDARVDEFPLDIFGVGLLAEIEPHASFGIDARYIRRVGNKFELNVGAIAYVAPSTLLGPSAGFKYRLLLSPSTAFTVGPEVNVFVLGSDLPDGTIIWQGLLQVGIHADL